MLLSQAVLLQGRVSSALLWWGEVEQEALQELAEYSLPELSDELSMRGALEVLACSAQQHTVKPAGAQLLHSLLADASEVGVLLSGVSALRGGLCGFSPQLRERAGERRGLGQQVSIFSGRLGSMAGTVDHM